jgi:hypothetical protein
MLGLIAGVAVMLPSEINAVATPVSKQGDVRTDSTGAPTAPGVRRGSEERSAPIATYVDMPRGGVIVPVEPTYTPREEFLSFSPPVIDEEEVIEVVDTLRSDWLTTGPKTRRFEQEFAQYVGARGALALSSCTAGLHTALVALGIGSGDEVITTPMTFAATVNVIEHVGARPVLADIEPDTLNIDPRCIEAAITARTKAIIAVHYSGHPADLDAIAELARAHDLVVIEDAHRRAGVSGARAAHQPARDDARCIDALCERGELALRGAVARLQVQHDGHPGGARPVSAP